MFLSSSQASSNEQDALFTVLIRNEGTSIQVNSPFLVILVGGLWTGLGEFFRLWVRLVRSYEDGQGLATASLTPAEVAL